MERSECLQRLRGARCTVVGLGVSNRPLIEFLLNAGATLTARDAKERAAFGEELDALEARGVRLILGNGYLDGIDEDVIFRSPGIRPDIPPFCDAVARGARLTSEMELFMELCPATVIGITGSDGKTTTTTLTGLFLERACERRGYGRVYVGGNIGTPLLDRVFDMTPDDFAVVELSSFQLMNMKCAPHIAAITNLSPNHLNWHTDMDEYVAAKTHIYTGAACRCLVTNAENGYTAALARDTALPKTYFSSVKQRSTEFALGENDRAVYEREGVVYLFDGVREHAIVNAADIFLPGRHNLENYMTAIALTDGWVDSETVRAIAPDFKGVPHRLEPVREFEGVSYYNSSIDSSPTRTAAALSAMKQKPIVICGGSDKGTPFEPLAEALCTSAKAVILTGESAPKIRAALAKRPEVQSGSFPVLEAPDFDSAVRLSRTIAKEGDAVLLSPACASFDAFKNFMERGERFRAIVNGFT
ncbi:MAG: UDP-N-acetylmuramoyl-L-alanine--D-glutamate ligase [Clostridia bacterium]|nr:UDP-N-acetylmuramoyl-L-alanine--D-glutamate ligase [Clostridia bacterium]